LILIGDLGFLSEWLLSNIKQRIGPVSTLRRMAGVVECEANHQEHGKKSQDNPEHFANLFLIRGYSRKFYCRNS